MSTIRTYFGMPDWDDLLAPCTPVPIFFGITGMPPACDKVLGKTVELMWGRYEAATQILLDGDFGMAALNQRIDELESLISEHVASDPNGPTITVWQAALTELRATIVDKRAYVEAKLP